MLLLLLLSVAMETIWTVAVDTKCRKKRMRGYICGLHMFAIPYHTRSLALSFSSIFYIHSHTHLLNYNMVQDNNNNENTTITHSDTEITVIGGQATSEQEEKTQMPEAVYMHKSSDFMYNKSAATISTRQLGCMSNYSLEMHPRIITKDASYSFIWIDDQYKNIETSDTAAAAAASGKRHFFHTRGFCNLFTILFIIAIILFLFIYPFATFFFK
ncbi:hypothetical protein FB192DRAFT_1400261 [Mucor lusitanicus]|uniref:Uncharacterized protein n=1 Tax=Mucor circinelloides f. lusitanicus TaxID=29924 RepID=A0A8H4B9M3_MUCCL|nr:hypothetical protein FB192DRAFT_1400261 [Mucor lusitanicus]